MIRAVPTTIRGLFACLLYLAAAVPPALWVLYSFSPTLADDVASHGATTLRLGLWLGAGAAFLALLFYPPSLPWLRLRLRRLRTRLATNQVQVLEAEQRLRHFDNAADHLFLGRVRREQRALPQALGHLQHALALEPDSIAARYQFGLVLLQVRALPQAIELLSAVVAQDDHYDYGDALLALATAQHRAGADADAEATLARYLARSPDTRRALLLQGQVLAALGRHDAAIAAWRRAARPFDDRSHRVLEDELARAQARVALWRRLARRGDA